MDCEHPEVIKGQTSINELLIALGEPPVADPFLPDPPDNASEVVQDAPALPGL